MVAMVAAYQPISNCSWPWEMPACAGIAAIWGLNPAEHLPNGEGW